MFLLGSWDVADRISFRPFCFDQTARRSFLAETIINDQDVHLVSFP